MKATALLLAAWLLVPGALSASQSPAGTSPQSSSISSIRVINGTIDYNTFKQPLGVAMDSVHHELYIANSGFHRIDVYSFQGRLKARLPHRVHGPEGGLIDGDPIGLALDSRGRLFVVDNRDTMVDVLDYRGRSIRRLALRLDDGRLARPSAVAVAPDGRIAVGGGADSARVFLFSAELEPIGSWGEAGAGKDQLSNILAMAFMPSGDLVITRAQDEPMVQMFTAEGRFVRAFGFLADGAGNFSLPTGVAVTRDGRIWICDHFRQDIQVFDSTGTFVAQLGEAGTAPGHFYYPFSLATDGDRRLAVTERIGGRLQLFQFR